MEKNTQHESGSKKSPFDDLSREELLTKCKGLFAIAQKAKQAKSELHNEVENYKIQLDKCETEKSVSIENVHTLQELVDSLTEQKLNYITEIDSVKNKIKILSEKCNKYEEEIQKNKAEDIIKAKYVVDATQKLSDLDIEVTSLKRQNNRLEEENDQLLSQLTELETRIAEFNNIGLQQQEQLQKLEENVQTEDIHKAEIDELNNKVKELEDKLQITVDNTGNMKHIDYENKIRELTQLYEDEKSKKEKSTIKLRSYKDKILKCAACINQLKNSRFILAKTVKDYSEIIPKWQNDILKASKVLDAQVIELNNENTTLKEKVLLLEKQLNEVLESQNRTTTEKDDSRIFELSNENKELKTHLFNAQQELEHMVNKNITLNEVFEDIKHKYQKLNQTDYPDQINKNKLLKEHLNELNIKFNQLLQDNNELHKVVQNLKSVNQSLNDSLQSKAQHNEVVERIGLQVKALESEKAILVKEKLTARDSVVELEKHNRILTDQVEKLRSDVQTLKAQLDTLIQEKSVLEVNYKKDKDDNITNVKCKIMSLEEQYELLKIEYDNIQDLNGLLKEEVETLKLSLEQPKDDAENLSDLNVSLQADIVKLETKLSAYKQENSSLLAEVKESRAKVKEFDAIVIEYEDFRSKLSSYKTENAELLSEMKEINQVLKERGEAISKLQKAISEMERLVETLEKDRDDINKEKEDLYKTIGLLKNDLKTAQEKTSENSKISEQIIIERDNALKSLNEKEAVITSLKDEIEKLKQHQTSIVELPNEDMSTSTISKAEEHSRMKDLDETFEEKYTKLRMFALKLKKKLNDTTAQLQTTLQDKAKVEKLLTENSLPNTEIRPTNNDEMDSTEKEATNKQNIRDLEEKVKSLTVTLEASENVAAELEKTKAELATKTQQLTAEMEAHKFAKENLEKARRDVKKKNVLSLEMEDYERSMKELTTKMEESKKKMVQMESTIDTQEATITATKTQIKLLEEQIKTEETQNRLVKEELQHALEEGQEKDNVIQVKNSIILKLEQDLEDEKRKNEESNLETTALLSDKEKIIMSLSADKAELNNKLKKVEFKCAELKETLRITHIELEDLKTEYISYKVRAQAVLRQNQTVDHSQEEQLKEEAAALRAHIETLTAKLNTAQEQCSSVSAESAAAARRASEASGEAARAQQRTVRLHADLARLQHQLDAERAQHTLQISTLTQCYKAQISDLETKLQKETEELRQQLANIQEKVKSVRPNTVSADDANRNQYMLPLIPKEDGSDGELDINVSMIPREEGEGSESAPTPPLSKPYLTNAGGGRSPVSLERLLEEGVPDDEALDTTSLGLTPEQEICDLKRKLNAQQQRVKHITVLLSESERECARMAQLSELLKGELRRVRGAEHTQHNTEYMKNVTLKFLTLPPGDERGRLVPVLQKILTLTSDETHKIHAIAKGLDPNPSKGWGSYLPWPGGK